MLKPLEICDFDKVYKIMDESFPSDERRSYDGQKSFLKRTNTVFLRVMTVKM